jgi:hypothetical protein
VTLDRKAILASSFDARAVRAFSWEPAYTTTIVSKAGLVRKVST